MKSSALQHLNHQAKNRLLSLAFCSQFDSKYLAESWEHAQAEDNLKTAVLLHVSYTGISSHQK